MAALRARAARRATLLALPILAGCGPTTTDVGAGLALAAPLGWLVGASLLEGWTWLQSEPYRPPPLGAVFGPGLCCLLGAGLAAWRCVTVPVPGDFLLQALWLVPTAAVTLTLLHGRLAAAWGAPARVGSWAVPLCFTLSGLLLQHGLLGGVLAPLVLCLVLWGSGAGVVPAVLLVLLLGELWARRRFGAPGPGRLLWSLVAGLAWAGVLLGAVLDPGDVDAGPTPGREGRAACAQEVPDQVVSAWQPLDTPVPAGAALRLACVLPTGVAPRLRLSPGAPPLDPGSCTPGDTWPRPTQTCVWVLSPLPEHAAEAEILDGEEPFERVPMPPG